MDSYLFLASFLHHSILPGDYNEDFVFQVGLVMMVVWISDHRGVWGLAKAHQFLLSPFFPAVSPQVWGEALPAVGCGVPW